MLHGSQALSIVKQLIEICGFMRMRRSLDRLLFVFFDN